LRAFGINECQYATVRARGRRERAFAASRRGFEVIEAETQFKLFESAKLAAPRVNILA
jgi:hypothetical protein